MLAFIIYELKVAVVLAAFYLCFKLLLSRENLHRVNRAVLICTSVLSFVLPLCIITLHKTVPEPLFVESGVLEEISPTAGTISDAGQLRFDWRLILIVTYWLGFFAVLSSITVGIMRVMKLINSGERKKLNGTEVIVCNREVAPFSWMKWIVMCSGDFESGNNHILEHEKAHVRLGHSKDVLLVDILSALQWFNPAIWLLKRELRAVHEYEADDAVLRNGADIREYQYSLIRKAVSASGYSITNSFNHSILKKRITMMSKSKVSWMRGLRAIYILPLIGGSLVLNARTVVDYEVSEKTSIQQKPVKVEIKMEGERIAYYVDGEKTGLELLSEKISAHKRNDGYDSISLVFDDNIEMGTVTEVMELLRSLDISLISSRYITPKPKSIQESETVPFQMLEVKPTFNGGDAGAFAMWVANNLQYPAEAEAAGLQGRVLLQFTVSETGKLKDVKVLRGVEPSLDAEAVRVVSASPDWVPGEAGGKPVATTYAFPVIFNLK